MIMDMSRFLVLCVLVAVAYAQVKKSKRAPLSGMCNEIKEALDVNQLPARYHLCGESEAGRCFDRSARCDDIVDCPGSFTDELDCKAEHLDDCNNGYKTKPNGGAKFKCQAAGQDPDDRMCILGSWECDGKRDCPLGDDEADCQ